MTTAQADALTRVTDALEARGLQVRRRGDDVAAQCPAHHDESPSLSISYNASGGKVLLNCQTGCATTEILAALDLRWSDLFDRTSEKHAQSNGHQRSEIVATYGYHDAGGQLLYQKLRMFPKDFRVRRPDGNGGWTWKIGDVPRVLYKLPEVLQAINDGRPILLVEGEKDADRVASELGMVATCNYEGAAKEGQRSKWRREYTDQLAGARVLIVADNDEAGLAHARAAAAALRGTAAEVRIFRPATDWAKSDLTDHLDAGHSIDQLVPVDTAAQPTDPPAPDLRPADELTEAEHKARRFERDVELKLHQLTVNEQAMRRLRAERVAVPPPLELLTDFLAEDIPDAEYRIDDLLPVGGRAVLAAQFKAGKTTMMGNLVRSLADGDVFLGDHSVNTSPGPIVLLDAELDRRMMQRWLSDHHIERTDRVALVSLRGRLSSFDLTDPTTLQEWAARIGALEPSMVILDPLRPILDAIGLDEDKEAGRFLVAFDEFLDRAGASEAVVVHHMGHQGERARGSSRLRDWPDVEWRLVRGDPEDPTSPRFFTAYGRDVDQPERELTFNPTLRRLTIFGGSRKDGELKVIGDEVIDVLGQSPGLTAAAIDKRLAESGHTRKNIRAALQRAINAREIATRPGNRNSTLHYLPGDVPPPGGRL